MKLKPEKKIEIPQERKYDQRDPIQVGIHTRDWSGTTKRPNKKCKHCYGTGNNGYDILYEKYRVCGCIKKPEEGM